MLRYLIIGLVDQAFQVQLVSGEPAVSALAFGPVSACIHAPMHWPFSNKRVRQTLEALADNPPSVVHALSHESLDTATAIAGEFDVDLLLTVSSRNDVEALGRVDRRQIARYAATSAVLASALTSRWRIAAQDVHVVLPGFLSTGHMACFLDAAHDPTILCTTPFVDGGGVEILIEAIAGLRNRGQSVLAFLFGHGRHEHALRQLVRARRLEAVITFAQPAGDLTPAFEFGDLFVDTSADHWFDAQTLRAMATGVCVVALRKDVSSYLEHEKTAVVCEAPTVACLVENLERLLLDRERARAIAGGGVEFVRANHSVSGMAERMSALYRDMAAYQTTYSIRE